MLDKAKELLTIINTSGGEGRVVGGYVRDFLISINRGSLPGVKDIDIATTLTPDKVTEAFESKGIRVIPTGIEYGTVTVVYEGKNYEITTLRNDISTDGRHAKVSFTKDWVEDASRRDFTMNAMYIDIDGKIYDYFDGQNDLKQGVVRFIGNPEDRIKEDYLRILRMFRFHTLYGKGKILENQLMACKDLSNGLDIISGERIRAEMLKILSGPSNGNTLYCLYEMLHLGILHKITYIENEDFRLEKISKLYELSNNPDPILTLAVILYVRIHDEIMAKFMERWRLTNEEQRFLNRLMESVIINFKDSYEVRKCARTNTKDEFFKYIMLNYAKDRIDKKLADKLMNFGRNFSAPEFPITSQDLMKKGVEPGKKFGELLKKAEEIWERSEYQLGKEEILNNILGTNYSS